MKIAPLITLAAEKKSPHFSSRLALMMPPTSPIPHHISFYGIKKLPTNRKEAVVMSNKGLFGSQGGSDYRHEIHWSHHHVLHVLNDICLTRGAFNASFLLLLCIGCILYLIIYVYSYIMRKFMYIICVLSSRSVVGQICMEPWCRN